MNKQDWSDICTILTQIESAIQSGNYNITKQRMQTALGIARRRYEDAANAETRTKS